jgi:pimeloyl-ACP methyl ester carboxylesterase
MSDGHQMSHPAILLLHGMFGRADNWQSCARHLSAHWRVLAPTLPVLDLPHAETDVHALVRFVEELLDREGIGQVVIGGNSLGGHVALSVALRNPSRVAGLVLAGSSGLFERGFDRSMPRRPDREWIRGKIREVFFEEMHVTEALVSEVHDTIKDTRKALKMLQLAKSAKRENLRDILHQVRCPVLLVWGTEDSITPPVIAHDFKEQIPHAELHFIRECGHAPNIERPEELNRIVEQFLKKHFGYAYAAAPSRPR